MVDGPVHGKYLVKNQFPDQFWLDFEHTISHICMPSDAFAYELDTDKLAAISIQQALRVVEYWQRHPVIRFGSLWIYSFWSSWRQELNSEHP